MAHKKATATTRRVKRKPTPPGLRYDVLARANFTCQACGEKVPKIRLEIDHIIPVSQGGLTVSENLQALCVACNRGKAAKMKAMRKVQPQAKPKKAKPKKGKKPKKSQS